MELKLDLIRVDCNPNALFKYQLIYKDETATGVANVYSFDEDWYYLYKSDTERCKVKRRKDLEGIPTAFAYKQPRKRRADQPDKPQTPVENTSARPWPTEVEVQIASLHSEGSVRGTAVVCLNNCFTIRNVKIIDGGEGLLVAMPGYQTEDGKYQDICLPVTEAFRQKLNAAVIQAYRQMLDQHQSETAAPSSLEETLEQSDTLRMDGR